MESVFNFFCGIKNCFLKKVIYFNWLLLYVIDYKKKKKKRFHTE